MRRDPEVRDYQQHTLYLVAYAMSHRLASVSLPAVAVAGSGAGVSQHGLLEEWGVAAWREKCWKGSRLRAQAS